MAGAAYLTVEAASRNEDGFDQRTLERVRSVEGVELAVPRTSADTMLILEDVEVAVKTFGVSHVKRSGARVVVSGVAGDQDQHREGDADIVRAMQYE